MHFCQSIMFFIYFLLYVPVILSKYVTYKGENFPLKYLRSDTTPPVSKDLNYFISHLKKTLYVNTKAPNNTNANIAIGTYFVTAILQRTLIDNEQKLTKPQRRMIVNLINRGKYYLSHYIYTNRRYGYRDMEYRISVLYRDFDIFAHSMNDFNDRRLQKWIFSDINMHSYVKELDDISLNKETYIHLIEQMDDYNININDSDICIARVSDTPEPITMNDKQVCRDSFCQNFLQNGPSIAYALSHRVLNVLLRRNIRRCYLQSPKEDDKLLDQLCSFAYREVVYVARRGYFARDMFLEHVALCASLGYKEFFRMHWFYKATSWMDKAGCIQEDRNYQLNRTKLHNSLTNDKRRIEIHNKNLQQLLLTECHYHEMTCLSVVLAHAIRYVAHFMRT